MAGYVATKKRKFLTIEDAIAASDSDCLTHHEWLTFIHPQTETIRKMIKEWLGQGVVQHDRIMQRICLAFPDETFRRPPQDFGRIMVAVEHEIRVQTGAYKKKK